MCSFSIGVSAWSKTIAHYTGILVSRLVRVCHSDPYLRSRSDHLSTFSDRRSLNHIIPSELFAPATRFLEEGSNMQHYSKEKDRNVSHHDKMCELFSDVRFHHLTITICSCHSHDTFTAVRPPPSCRLRCQIKTCFFAPGAAVRFGFLHQTARPSRNIRRFYAPTSLVPFLTRQSSITWPNHHHADGEVA